MGLFGKDSVVWWEHMEIGWGSLEVGKIGSCKEN